MDSQWIAIHHGLTLSNTLCCFQRDADGDETDRVEEAGVFRETEGTVVDPEDECPWREEAAGARAWRW
jgi:hypothetical protein